MVSAQNDSFAALKEVIPSVLARLLFKQLDLLFDLFGDCAHLHVDCITEHFVDNDCDHDEDGRANRILRQFRTLFVAPKLS